MKVILTLFSSLSSFSILAFSILVCFSVFSNAEETSPKPEAKVEYHQVKSYTE